MTNIIDYQQLFEQQQKANEQLQETLRQQTQLIQQLQQQIEQLLRARYGKKSERQKKPNDQAGNNKPKKPKSNKGGHPRNELPASLPRVPAQHDVSEDEKYCPHCASSLTSIKPETVEKLAYRPGTLYVKKHIKCRYACRCCSRTIITASMPNQPIEKSYADPSLLTQVVIDKYTDHIPLYRQELRWLRQGINLSRRTLCDWVQACAKLIAPLVNAMKQDLLAQPKIHTDDTTIPVLAKGKTLTGRLWVYVGGGGYAPVKCVIYDYSPSRRGIYPEKFLTGFNGYLQADAYAGYDKLYEDGSVIEVACLAHARRKFFDAVQSVKDSDKAHSLSQTALEFIGQLYHIEHLTETMTSHERYFYRRKYAKPIFRQFYRWLKRAAFFTFPKSALGKAINYTLNHWRAFMNYLRDGMLNIDNNVAERAIKPVVLGRKNYLFAGSHEGARSAAIIYSLIETCKLLNINCYDYLLDVLTRLPNTLNKDIRSLLPYHWSAVVGN